MVKPLPSPTRPLPRRGASWTWARRGSGAWEWCRIYHLGEHVPDAVTFRPYGPLYRFDHHTPPFKAPAICPDGRKVLYVAANLRAAVGEVFGDLPLPEICPNYRVSIVEPVEPVRLLDLIKPGGAMRIGALPAIANDTSRELTQEWARAIWEDQPVRRGSISGARYLAAHSNDPVLALWAAPDGLAVSRGSGGRPADAALHEIPGRVTRAFAELGMRGPLWGDACECG